MLAPWQTFESTLLAFVLTRTSIGWCDAPVQSKAAKIVANWIVSRLTMIVSRLTIIVSRLTIGIVRRIVRRLNQ